MRLICKATCAPVVAPFEGQGDNAPVMHPRSGIPANNHQRMLESFLLTILAKL